MFNVHLSIYLASKSPFLRCDPLSAYATAHTVGRLPLHSRGVKAITFDIDLFPNEDSMVVVVKVPSTANQMAVGQLVASFVYAFAVAEGTTLDEMETNLATMMTLTRVTSGTQIHLKRVHSDPTYFGRFDRALNGKTLLMN